jgi:hypothetical protein
MITNVWAKYLPILRIVLKKAVHADQVFALNAPDFERAGYKRKSGYKFQVKLKDGRLDNVLVDAPVASAFVRMLLDDPTTKEIITNNEFHISLNSKWELTFKHIVQEETLEEAAVLAEEA